MLIMDRQPHHNSTHDKVSKPPHEPLPVINSIGVIVSLVEYIIEESLS